MTIVNIIESEYNFFVLLQIARDIVSGDADTTRDDRDLETYQTSSQGRKLIV